MLARLAFGNIRRTMRDYAVYAITLVLGVAVFYAFNTIAVQADFLDKGSSDIAGMLESIREILTGVTVALAIVMGFLMVYANNYLMRRRTKELGLYQVLGMRVGQVNAILVLETLMVAAISLVAGIALGMLVSQLMIFLTARLFETSVSHFRFFVSPGALLLTIGCFVLIFLVMMLFNARSLRHVRLVDLMSSGRHNETYHLRSLPTSVSMLAAGLVLVAVAYARLSSQGIPGFSEGMGQSGDNLEFVLTTILVTMGTIMLFFGLAGTLAGTLPRLKGYWRGLTMYTVRQISARVNTTCMSMALISMVLFLAITSVTSGMLLVQGLNKQTESMASFGASVICVGERDDTTEAPSVADSMRKVGIDPDDLGRYAQVNLLNPYTLAEAEDADIDPSFDIESIARSAGRDVPRDLSDYQNAGFGLVVSLSDYNALRRLRNMDEASLDRDQYLILAGQQSSFNALANDAMAHGHKFKVADTTLKPARTKVVDDGSQYLMNSGNPTPLILVVPDAVASKCTLYEPALDIMGTSDRSAGAGRTVALDSRLEARLEKGLGRDFLVYTRSSIIQNMHSTSGLIVYLAIYIGFVLVITCAAILAIQQLSAASDALPSFRTLSELGCPERLLFGSLRTQVAVAFLLPLAVAVAHSACALKVVNASLSGMMDSSIAASSPLAVAIFVLAYGAYLAVTYRTAHGIVRSGIRSARRAL